MTRFAIAGLAGMAAVFVGAAAPAERPLYLPTHDVAVTYSVERQSTGAPQEAHFYYSAAAGKLRLETPAQKGFVIIDRNANVMTVVMPRQHIYVESPLPAEFGAGFMLNDKMSFTRVGEDRVAGHPCTVWNIKSDRATGTVCITPDGVLLRAHGQDRDGTGGGLQATAISDAPQPAGLFTPPPDFRRVNLPAMPLTK